MLKPRTSIVKKSLISWILMGNPKLKLLLLLAAIVTVLIRVIPLEMQKRIVNQAISLKVFDLLLIYCGIYLVAVICASALKYAISYLQTIIGQQALTDMRQELYRHVLSLIAFTVYLLWLNPPLALVGFSGSGKSNLALCIGQLYKYTSALDNNSQARIQRLLDTRLRGKTTLIAVAHRLDIIKNFDKIGVLKSGKIEEMGTYSELMEKRGLLYELVQGKR